LSGLQKIPESEMQTKPLSLSTATSLRNEHFLSLSASLNS
jgi:hypothetical protein